MAWVRLNDLPAGTDADWFAAVGTVGALLAGLVAFRHQQEATRDAERERDLLLQQGSDQVAAVRSQSEATRVLADAARTQAALAAEQLTAASRPLLAFPRAEWSAALTDIRFTPGIHVSTNFAALLFPTGTDPEYRESAFVAIPVENIGLGPAILLGVDIGVSDEGCWSGTLRHSLLKPDGVTHAVFVVPDRPEMADLRAAVWARSGFHFDIAYRNAAGADQQRSRFYIVNERVRQIAVFDGTSREHRFITGPVDALKV